MRRLGQHFLINKRKIQKIVEALELKEGDTIIEIGPGHGELTKELRISAQGGSASGRKNSKLKIIAIEKDENLAEFLKEKLLKDKNIEIIKGDALKILPEITKSHKLKAKSYKVVGNIPYYITGYLFRILGELETKPPLIVLMIQEEVAERVCAVPPLMNLLAASVQFWTESKIIGSVSKRNFRPMPKVDSAIIKLKLLATVSGSGDKYYKFIKVLFKQPRKTILNNLRPITNNLQLLKEKLESIGVNSQARPQNLNIKQIAELSTLF